MLIDVTPKERKRILVRMVFILLSFFIIAFVLSQFLLISGLVSGEKRILCFSAVILPGLVVSGIYASKKFAINYEEFTWGVTVFLMLSIAFGALFFQFYLLDLEVTQSVFNLILSMFLLWLPISMVTGFFAFEILLSRKIKKPFSFYAKRFVGRMILAEIVFLLVVAISSIVNLLAPFLSEKYLVTMLIFANSAAGIVLYVFTRNPRVGRFFSRLEKASGSGQSCCTVILRNQCFFRGTINANGVADIDMIFSDVITDPYNCAEVSESDESCNPTDYSYMPNVTSYINVNGTDYPVCTTIQYGYKPSANSTWLTVEPQATQTATTTKKRTNTTRSTIK